MRPILKTILLAPRAVFDPAKLASARAWYEADRISAFSSGSSLGTWADASTNARDATQATAGSKPTMQTRGGVKVVRFDGNDFLTVPSSLSLNTRTFTLFVVVYPNLRHNTSPAAYFGSQTASVFVSLMDRLSNPTQWNGGLQTFTNGPVAGDAAPYVVSNYMGKVGGSDRYAPAVLMLQLTASQSLYRSNGLDYSNTAVASATMTGGTLGAFNGGTFFNGDLYAAGIFESMPDADRDTVYSSLLTKYGYTYTNSQGLIVPMGDSLTQGVTSTSQLNEYPSQLIGLLNTDGKPYQLYNDARSGARIQHVSARLPVYVTPKYSASRTKNIAVLWVGSNDISNSVTGSQAYTDLSAVISSLKATGWTVAVLTMLPRTDVSGTKETERGNFNTAIVGNAGGADYVVNLGSVANLQTPSNTTYFAADAIHLTDTGYGLVAQAVHDAIAVGA